MTTMPKIISFSREKIEFDLTGMDRKDIKDALSVVGFRDESSDEWLELIMGKRTQVYWQAHKEHSDNGGGFTETTVSTDYIRPYLERLKEWTGWELPIGEEIPINALTGLFHTHGVKEAKITAEKNPYGPGQGSDEGPVKYRLLVQGFTHVFLYSGEQPISETVRKQRAEERCIRYAIERLGSVQPEREFIETTGGLYKRNPNYGTGKPSAVTRCCDNEKVWQELFGWWFERHASEGQKAIIARMAHIWSGEKACFNEKWPSLRSYDGIHLDGYATRCSIEDFRAGKVPPVPEPKAEAK